MGAPPAPDTVAEVMADVQTLYRTEMERNGYGAKTFRLETDNAGQVIVHTVNGRQNTAHYQATTYDSIKAELPNRFLNQNNITVIIAGGLRLIDNRVWGIGFPIYGWVCGGQALIAAENPNFGVPLIAHELGHALGLYHNIIGDASIMGRGRGAPADVIEFNDYETRWLDKHHYFNDVHAIAHIPEVVHAHRFREVQQDIIRFRFRYREFRGIASGTGLSAFGCGDRRVGSAFGQSRHSRVFDPSRQTQKSETDGCSDDGYTWQPQYLARESWGFAEPHCRPK